MNLRFDHAVIGVRDVAEAGRFYADNLGFGVYPGGRHTGLGTQNAIVRFGLDYLELLSVSDREEAMAAGPGRASLVEYLDQHVCGALGFALATDDLDVLATRLRAEGLDAIGPYPMRRIRPDGVLLEWRLLVPSGTAWRRPWPFFIQWGMPDAERLLHETPGRHPNGAKGVRGVTVAVHDLARAKDMYTRQLGLALRDEGVSDGVAWARYKVGSCQIDLWHPTDASELQEYMATHGEGLYQVWLESAGHAAAYLTERKTPVERVRDRRGVEGIYAMDGCGASLVLSP